MSQTALARNYAEALFELAARDGQTERHGEFLDLVVAIYWEERSFRLFLESPRIPVAEKQQAIRAALGDEAPEKLVRFLLVVLEKRRQRAIPAIAAAYRELLDRAAGRVRATVSVAFAPDEELRGRVLRSLEEQLERTVEADFREEPRLIGGLRVRVGDQVMDGSLRRRLEDLRRNLMATGRDAARA